MYKAFKIPFSTKKKSSFHIEGDAYYLFNIDGEIIKQFIQLTKANYRPTDVEMLTTDYYKKDDQYISIRKKYLETINPLDIHKKSKIREELDSDILTLINKDLLKLSRVKSSLDIFTGSNSSGAESSPKKCEIIYYSNGNPWCNGINFSNPLNKCLVAEYKKYCKNIIINTLDKDIEIYNFIDVIEKDGFQNFYKLIKSYNTIDFYLKDKNLNDVIREDISNNENLNSLENDINNESKNYKSKRGGIDYYNLQIEKIINDYNDDFINSNQSEKKLRLIQKVLLNIQIKSMIEEKVIDSYNSLEGDEIANYKYEHAHIVSVRTCKREDRYKDISDPNNCLILSPSIHSLFDDSKITFSDDGSTFSNNDKINHLKIKNELLNDDRKKYLKENFIYFQKNKVNK